MPNTALGGFAGTLRSLLLATCLAVLVEPTLANDVHTVTCFDCGEIQYQNTAGNAIQFGHATVYLADLHRKQLRKYLVIKEQEPGYTFTHVQVQDLDAEDQAEWAQMLHVLQLVEEQKSLHASDGANGIDSAVTLGALWSSRGIAEAWTLSQLRFIDSFNALGGTRFSPVRLVGDLSQVAGPLRPLMYRSGSKSTPASSAWTPGSIPPPSGTRLAPESRSIRRPSTRGSTSGSRPTKVCANFSARPSDTAFRSFPLDLDFRLAAGIRLVASNAHRFENDLPASDDLPPGVHPGKTHLAA
jgi:hypothetical protein